MMIKEQAAVAESGFTHCEVQEFRRIFVAEDKHGTDCMTFETCRWLIHRVCKLTQKQDEELAGIWKEVVVSLRGDNAADFPDFLLLMKRLLDSDFAGIRNHTAE